jgi:hypothetical protein
MLVQIASYTTAIEAHLARGRLEAEGVPAFVFHEHHVWADWLVSRALKGVKVYAHQQDGERARTIVAAHDRAEYALAEEDEPRPSCPRCQAGTVVRQRLSWRSAMLVTNLASIPLYFRWATEHCSTCGHDWDLPTTQNYSMGVLFAAVVFTSAAILTLFLFAAWLAKAVGEHFIR